MHTRSIFAVTIAAMLLFGAIAAWTQVREQITVEEVDVPVYVFSRGKPVRNLTKDDFELFVNGKRQPIDYFEAVDFTETPPAAVPSPQSAPATVPAPQQPEIRDRRLFLLLFDLVFKHPNLAAYAAALDRGRRGAVDLVDHALPGDFFAVAAVTTNGIKFAMPFSRDHDAVRRAILQLAPSKALDFLGISITPSERGIAESWMHGAQPGAGEGMKGEDPLPDIFAASQALERQRETLNTNDRIEGYGQLAARLRGLEGFKHVILFSDGYPTNPLDASYSVKQMASAFQSANVYLHTVDLTPIQTGADPTVGDPTDASNDTKPQVRPSEDPSLLGNPYIDWFAPNMGKIPASENEGLFWMANETGGSWIHWTNLIAPALNNLSESYSAAYRLGFKPSDAHKGHNDINVKVKNLPAGARVSFRKGFTPSVPSKAAPDSILLADIIQNDTPQSGTPPEVSFVGRRIDVVVPVIQLSKQFGAVAGADVMLYIFDSSGVPVLSKEKKFTIPEHAAADRVIQQKLDLPPGNYVAKVLMRAGDSLAFVKEPFEIATDQPSQ